MPSQVGTTPLHYAAFAGLPLTMQRLLKHGAMVSLNATNQVRSCAACCSVRFYGVH